MSEWTGARVGWGRGQTDSDGSVDLVGFSQFAGRFSLTRMMTSSNPGTLGTCIYHHLIGS